MKNTFLPDYIVHPIEVLYDILSSVGMNQSELNIITSITPEISKKLESLLGIPASFWNNLEREYQNDLKRLS